jgi:predicted dienelactone hydrolase
LAKAYDPLATAGAESVKASDFDVRDEARQRDIPVRVYLPPQRDPAPVVLFSHGLGGMRQGNPYLGNHWAARGYVVVFLQHAGSDDSVWKDQPREKRMAAMQQAASLKNFLLRAQDVPRVLDQLDEWNKDREHPLFGRLDMSRVGMSGHSFGAVTTQAVSGQSLAVGGQRLADPRIKAAVAFSPSRPVRGEPAVAFGSVKIPWLLMTGTKDSAPIGQIDAAARLDVYPHLPATIDKYELVLFNAEHSAFNDRALPGDRETRNPNHHRIVLALSTAFWDAYLRDDAAARDWLQGTGARAVLEEQDRWQFHAAQRP